jgi:predicted O-methyltransferase YrrM
MTLTGFCDLTFIVADNVACGGAVTGSNAAEPGVRGIRAFIDRVAAEPRLNATAIRTVGE